VIENRPGFILFRAFGKNIKKYFINEAGGHRIQRSPPTEKRGRIHTSTITVAVLDEALEKDVKIDKKDIEEKFTRGSGPGGQHRNKTDSCVVLTHIPTGITVRAENGKSQYHNRQTAMEILRAKLSNITKNKIEKKINNKRKQQVGTGMRADKIRTVQVKNGIVIDHRLGKRIQYKKYRRGDLSSLRQ